MLHLYWGNGKGKTTAAMGLALRALGHGRRVVIVQFLKDGTSGEIAPLRTAGATVYACPNAKFTWLMDENDKAQARAVSADALEKALAQPFDLLVLDEACAALKSNILDEALLRKAAAFAKDGREVVVTGRDPAPWLQDAADYSTEMQMHKHPYTQGLQGSFPSLKGENKTLTSIPGFLPDLSKPCEGCVFAPRCAHATERCRKEKPPMFKTGEMGGAACWLCEGHENG